MVQRFLKPQVELRLAGSPVLIAQSYTVATSVVEVPASFSLKLSQSTKAANLAKEVPEWTPFELYIDDVLIQTGETDGYTLGESDPTEITITGRDLLARLVDTQIESERTFAEKTFFDLTLEAFDEVGLGEKTLLSFNAANRKAITGVQSIREIQPATTEGTETEVGESGGRKVTRRTIKAEVGTSWFDFLLEQYKKVGLFLWSRANGDFTLSEPNKNTDPVYRIIRRGSESNVLGQPKFMRDGQKRYSECAVHGRYGGGKNGRGKVIGRFIDDEVVTLLNQHPADRAADNGRGLRKKPLVIHDDKIQTKEQAEFLARRRIAESRRTGWVLEYRIAGHATPALAPGGGNAIWQPDTTVEVIDEEIGVFGNMYIHSVEHRAEPETHTIVKLMRVEDMFFAEQVPSTGKATSKVKGIIGEKPREGVTTIERRVREFNGTIFFEEQGGFITRAAGRTRDAPEL